jgi:dihydrofolate reductase
MTLKKLDLIAACDLNRGIGNKNELPWYLPSDLKFFNSKSSTRSSEDAPENIVIVGRKTWESFKPKHRPLPKRRNIVITRQEITAPVDLNNCSFTDSESKNKAVYVHTLQDAVNLAFAQDDESHCYVIGGAVIYEQALQHPAFDLLYLTEIDGKFECDVFFPPFESICSLISQSEVHVENGISYRFNTYQKKR